MKRKKKKYVEFLRYILGRITVFENRRKSLILQHYGAKNWWKLPKLKKSNETFWVIFKQCAYTNRKS